LIGFVLVRSLSVIVTSWFIDWLNWVLFSSLHSSLICLSNGNHFFDFKCEYRFWILAVVMVPILSEGSIDFRRAENQKVPRSTVWMLHHEAFQSNYRASAKSVNHSW
jgi:hypothetical protein